MWRNSQPDSITSAQQRNYPMKQLIDLLPGIVFFGVYFTTKDFMLATYALVIGSAAQIGLHWLLKKRLEKMHVAVFLILLPLAGMTLFLHDIRFLKWKPSIVNWIFAFILLGSYYFRKKNLAKTILHGLFANLPDIEINLPDSIWAKVNQRMALFFIAVGSLNLIVAYSVSTENWVTFKVFGLMAINFIGMITLFFYLTRTNKKLN